MSLNHRGRARLVGVALVSVAIGVSGVIGCACKQKSKVAERKTTVPQAANPDQSVYAPIALAPQGAPRGSALTRPDFISGPPRRIIDLTEPGAVVHGTTPVEIIDTRTFETQIQASPGWDGRVRAVKEVLPRHARPGGPPVGPINTLPVGGLAEVVRTAPAGAFPGIGVGDSGGWAPPDPTLAVGPNHIVTTVNMAISFFSKDGTQEFLSPLNDTGSPGFFEPVGAEWFTFDPKCYYDQYSQRFVVIAPEAYDTTAWMCIAVSDDSDPHGVWYKYRTNCVITVGSDTFWLDYPGLGFDQDAIYITGNLFGLNNGGWAGVLFRIFDKAPLLVGGAASYTDLRDGGAGSVQVAHHFGANQAPYFVSVYDSSRLEVHAINDPLGSPSLVSTTVSVPSFSYLSGDAPNVGGFLWTIDSRIFNVHWRDGNLYAAHNIDVGGRNVARWYHLYTNDWPNSGSVTYVQSGNLDGGSGVHTYFPAIFSNQDGSVGMVLASSTSSTTPKVQVTARKTSDPLGTMGALTDAIVGPSGSDGRWGDYFDITTDPTDDKRFWFIGEYATGGGWATWISDFSVIACEGDLDADGAVGLSDLAILLSNYGVTSGAAYEDGDLTGDGAVALDDLAALLAVYGAPCN